MIKVLSLCGHDDDSIVAIGGTLRKIADAGGEVNIVFYGNGNEGYADIKNQTKIVALRQEEIKRSFAILGVKNHECFNYGDFAITANEETYKLAIGAIRRYKPDVIFTHYWKEYFQHRDTARLVTDAWWQAGWRASLAQGEPWAAGKLYYFEVIHLIEQPTHIVDISDTYEAKVAAWKAFASQDEFLDQMMVQMESKARFYGSLIGAKYGEALKLSAYLPQAINDIKEL